MTSRAVFDSVKNVLDFLADADLTVYTNPISVSEERITFTPYDRGTEFLPSREHPTVAQYLAWSASGTYSAVLFDGSLLQLTYDLKHGVVVGHRLVYFPCPFEIDTGMLEDGEPLVDVVELYRGGDATLRTPIRFDYDPKSARAHHPAAHLTINSVSCRIACTGPMHVLRFVDFVFKHFYHSLWRAHEPFFSPAAWRHAGEPSLLDSDRFGLHVSWNARAKMADVAGVR